MIHKQTIVVAAIVAVLALAPAACRKQEQAVVGVAQDAVNKAEQAAQQAKAAAAERDQQRATLAAIPLPTKSLYRGVRDVNAWMNPFLSVDADAIHLRTITPANAGSAPRSASSHTQEQLVQPADLANVLIALPSSTWRYGRVVAVAESTANNGKDRAQLRRNTEATMQQLNDLGIVAEEWPIR